MERKLGVLIDNFFWLSGGKVYSKGLFIHLYEKNVMDSLSLRFKRDNKHGANHQQGHPFASVLAIFIPVQE